MVYELIHDEQRFLLFPRHRTLHILNGSTLTKVVTMGEDAMISLLNAFNWTRR